MKLKELLERANNTTKGGKLPSFKKLTEQNLPVLLQLNIGDKKLVVYNNGLATYSDSIGEKEHHTVFSIYNLKLCYEYADFSSSPIIIADFPELLEYEACEVLMLCGQDRLDQNTYHREQEHENKLLEKAKKHSEEITSSFYEDFSDALIDSMVAEEESQKLKRKLYKALQTLTPNQKTVIELYFWKKMTQEQIAEKVGITRSSVQDRLEGAIKKLRKHVTR